MESKIIVRVIKIVSSEISNKYAIMSLAFSGNGHFAISQVKFKINAKLENNRYYYSIKIVQNSSPFLIG